MKYSIMTTKETNLKELTLRGIVIGALITFVFTASNIYLGLKVGMTFNSSIPAAVISMAILSFFSNSSILENNMVQTQASAAGTLSAVIFVLPALLMVGYWSDFHFWQTLMICAAGGVLGVVFSIPLRRTMVVDSPLPYPEGVAAAEILKVGHSHAQEDRGGAKEIFIGAGLAGIINLITGGLHLVADGASYWITRTKMAFQLPMSFSLALISAGYLMGVSAGIAMLLGAILTWFGFVPYLTHALPQANVDNIIDLSSQIWADRVRLIGAGTLAIASIWTLITLLKPMVEGVRLSFKSLHGHADGSNTDRTDQDLSSKGLLLVTTGALVLLVVAFYSFVQAAPISALKGWSLVVFAVVLAFIIGFFIAAACGYMAGLIGSSNSPISGIGIIAVIVVSLLLVLIRSSTEFLGGVDGRNFAMALAIFVTCAVVAVASISNDNLQDLKTGYLIGATPRNQQIALIIGCIVGSLVIAPVLGILYQAYGLVGVDAPRAGMDAAAMLNAPQATIVSKISSSIFTHQMDWAMIIIGLAVGAIFIVLDSVLGKARARLRLPALAIGLGIYLPPSISVTIAIGSLLKLLIQCFIKRKVALQDQSKTQILCDRKGILLASGMIVGESLVGVVLAVIILVSVSTGSGGSPLSMQTLMEGVLGSNVAIVQAFLGLAVFVSMCILFYRRTTLPARLIQP